MNDYYDRLRQYGYYSKNQYQLDHNKLSYSPPISYDDYHILEASLKQTEDPLDHFFQAKRVNLAKSMKDIVGLIDNRESIKDRNLYSIALGECELTTKLHNMEHWYVGKDPVMDKRRAQFERDLLEFDRQKRFEEVSAWKDTLLLKKDLRTILTELYKEQSKQKIIYGGL